MKVLTLLLAFGCVNLPGSGGWDDLGKYGAGTGGILDRERSPQLDSAGQIGTTKPSQPDTKWEEMGRNETVYPACFPANSLEKRSSR